MNDNNNYYYYYRKQDEKMGFPFANKHFIINRAVIFFWIAKTLNPIVWIKSPVAWAHWFSQLLFCHLCVSVLFIHLCGV